MILLAGSILFIHLISLLSSEFFLNPWVYFVTFVGLIVVFKDGIYSDSRCGRGVLLLTGAITAVVAVIALHWNFHDEYGWSTHTAFISSMLKGWYPPRYPTFPSYELRYHYGIDIFAALICTLLGVNPQRAIDIATVICVSMIVPLFWNFTFKLTKDRRASYVSVLLLFFGGGLPWVIGHPYWHTVSQMVVGDVTLDGARINPPFFSYLFQHPWVIGLPIALTILLRAIEIEERNTPSRAKAVEMTILITALSICHFPSFLVVSAIIFLKGLLSLRGARSVTFTFIGSLFVSLACATQLHGFFLPPYDSKPEIIFGGFWQLGMQPIVAWLAGSFGLLIPLGLFGMTKLQKEKLWLFCVIIGGILIPIFWEYTGSWDIQKFATVAQIFISVPAAAAISWLFSSPRPLVKMCGLIAIVGVCALNLSILYWLSGDPVELRPLVDGRDNAASLFFLPPCDDKVVAWLGDKVSPQELIFRNKDFAHPYAMYGAFSLPYTFPAFDRGFGFSKNLIRTRDIFNHQDDLTADILRKHNIRWVILDAASEQDEALRKRLNGLLTHERSFCTLDIFSLH